MIFVFLILNYFTSLIISRFVCVPANGIISFFYMAESYSVAYMHHLFSIHSSGHVVCLHVLALVNGAAVHTQVHVSFQILVFSAYTLRGCTTGSCGSSTFTFKRHFHIVLYGGCYHLHPTSTVKGFPFLHALSIFFSL